MRNKSKVKQYLNADLVKYCEQIGIPENERPTVIWDKPTFKTLTGARSVTRRTMGYAHYESNMILVDLGYKAKQIWRRYYTESKAHRVMYRKVKFTVAEVRNTLIHELVHMRWQNLRHGYWFYKRILDIIAGTKYELRTDKDLTEYYVKGRAARQQPTQSQPSPFIETRHEPAFPRQFELIRLQL